jgi:transglutaminase/protease-like cytokinesis protein 3
MKLIFGMHPYFNPTRSNMEDNLNILKWKTTSIFLKKEDDLNFLKMEDDLKKIMQPIKSKNNNSFENGRQPQFF